MERIIKRGDIYYANLCPVIGSEQGGIRPVLIISNDTGNRYSPTVIVAAITSRQAKPSLPIHFPLNGIDGLPANSVLLCEQLRTIDKCRLKGKLTQLDSFNMEAIIKPLLISIGIKMNAVQSKRRGTDD